ncbi:MAG: chemotaxis protein CheA [Dehalococcoidales bacterium]|nr:chemotaxis protein CheA [Dehalococcoidales bacterium]
MELADGITQEDLKLFLLEADELLQLLDEDFIRLEKEADNTELLQDIFRAAHTLKGSSAMIGHHPMSELAHAMENVLDRVRKRTLMVSPGVVDALLNGLDAMRALKEELVTQEPSGVDVKSLIADLEKVMAQDAESEAKKVESQSPGQSIFSDSPESEAETTYYLKVNLKKDSDWTGVRCFQIIQILISRGRIIRSNPPLKEIDEGKGGPELELVFASKLNDQSIRELINSVEEVDEVVISTEAQVQKPEAEKSGEIRTQGFESGGSETGYARKESQNQTVRVDVSRLDALMEQIGELVINRNRIASIGKTLGERYPDDELIQNLSESLSQIGKIVSILQQDIMNIRMLPIEIMFNTLPRMVRDLARKMGKKVNFIVEGEETEVDRSVIEHLRDPLMHLLRNAIDHGIETAEERKAAGKTETGTIRLSAYHEEDNIVITVVDDGKGINPALVKESAIRKQIITREAADKMTDEEAINLIFASGVSTARKITELSGRGVGLDVVKTNVEALNGTVSVDSRAGQGTRFTLRLPLTLAIIPSLLVSTRHATCAIPLANIVEVGKLDDAEIKTVRGKEVILSRGVVLPLLRLNNIFGWGEDGADGSGENYIVIVKVGETQAGLMVDSLIEQQEIVVKSLDQLVGGANCITGASILGDGQVVLILDVPSLINGAARGYYDNTGIKIGSELASMIPSGVSGERINYAN